MLDKLRPETSSADWAAAAAAVALLSKEVLLWGTGAAADSGAAVGHWAAIALRAGVGAGAV